MNIEDVNELRNIFSTLDQAGVKLPNVKDVADKTIFYLKINDIYYEHVMLNNVWHKKVVDSEGNLVLTKV